MSLLIPYALAGIHKFAPDLETYGLLRWVTEHPFRSQFYCGAIVVVAYLFYAPYKVYSRLDTRLAVLEARRPNYEFVIGWVDSIVQILFGQPMMAVADAVLRLKNNGTITAYEPKARIYYCWLDRPSEIQQIVCDTFGGKTPVHHTLDIPFRVTRVATQYPVVPPGQPNWNFGTQDELVIWIETESSAGSPEGPTFTDEIQRFSVVPYDYVFGRKMFSFQSSRHQRTAEAHFQEFRRKEKESNSTPPLPGLDREEPPQSPA